MKRRDPAGAALVLSEDARERLSEWPREDRGRFDELIEDAVSDLQREMLQRALGCGRSLSELHAFADALRALPDQEIYETCTLSSSSGLHDSVVARLRAEADPLYAFTANGNTLSPRHTFVHRVVPPEAANVVQTAKRPIVELGASPDDPVTGPGSEGALAEDLLNASVRGLGIHLRERPVDGPSFPLERALDLAAAALERGIPVPVVLGPKAGEHHRYALLLQVQPAGSSRAFELHDPTADETVWINAGDFVNRAELPLSNKTLRRITAIALPKT
ncbi:MAG TPA: hypothetical protein VH208_09180 [Myxococcaceae bacterium]|nr:hypothetical protein [Myxococcaceae bacterium]